MCQGLAASTPSPIPLAFQFPPAWLVFSPPSFGMPFLQNQGSKQKPAALLPPGCCSPSVPISAGSQQPLVGLQQAAGPGRAVMQTVLQGLLPATIFLVSSFFFLSKFPVWLGDCFVFPLTLGRNSYILSAELVFTQVMSWMGSPSSKDPRAKASAKHRETVARQGRGRRGRMVTFLLFEQKWATELTQPILPDYATRQPESFLSLAPLKAICRGWVENLDARR